MKNIETFKDVYSYCGENNLKLVEFFQEQDIKLLEISKAEFRAKIYQNILVTKEAVANGLKNPSPSITGLSGEDSVKIINYNSKLLNPYLKKVSAYALSLMEENLRMGRILACPTAGSCGILPSVLLAYADEFKVDDEKIIDAFILAGAIGKYISYKTALSGAVAGCQSECGVASAMAAGALVYLQNGSDTQILNAASLALKNILGLVCDPVAGLVEIPCVRRNAFLAIHAVNACEFSISGINSAIPLDDVVDALAQIGKMTSPMLKETSEAGLATTKTGLQIKEKLENAWTD